LKRDKKKRVFFEKKRGAILAGITMAQVAVLIAVQIS
jgi:hypothetical protein